LKNENVLKMKCIENVLKAVEKGGMGGKGVSESNGRV
jgi:hypothetical protein